MSAVIFIQGGLTRRKRQPNSSHEHGGKSQNLCAENSQSLNIEQSSGTADGIASNGLIKNPL